MNQAFFGLVVAVFVGMTPAWAGSARFAGTDTPGEGCVLLSTEGRGDGANGSLQYKDGVMLVEGTGRFDAVSDNTQYTRLRILDDSAWTAELVVASFVGSAAGDSIGLTLSTRLQGGGNAGHVSLTIGAPADKESAGVLSVVAEGVEPGKNVAVAQKDFPITLRFSKPGATDQMVIEAVTASGQAHKFFEGSLSKTFPKSDGIGDYREAFFRIESKGAAKSGISSLMIAGPSIPDINAAVGAGK